jgi:hypothetical protein
MKRLTAVLIALSGFGLSAAPGYAAVDNIKFNGFITIGGTYSNSEAPYDKDRPPCPSSPTSNCPGDNLISEDGNISTDLDFVNDTRVGLQVSAAVNPKIDVTAQLLARAKQDNSDLFVDWAFATYRATDWLSVRGGKLKFPTFLISDYFEVGYAYPWIRPPEEVYSSNPISTITGVDLLGNVSLGPVNLLVQPFYGTSHGAEALVPQEVVDLTDDLAINGSIPQGTVLTASFDASPLVGLNVQLSTDVVTAHIQHLQTFVSAPSFGTVEDKVTFSTVGATMDWFNVVVYAEYFEREIEGSSNLAFPNTKGYYTTLGYRIGKFLPHITYASLDENGGPTPFALLGTGGIAPVQTSVTAGLRYELGNNAALKFEAKKIEPESSIPGNPLAPARGLLIGPPPDGDVIIYSLALDAIF